MYQNYYVKLFSYSLFLFFSSGLFAQETARDFFSKVSNRYNEITDLQANIVIKSDSQKMRGNMVFKAPNLLQINFSFPVNQVLNITGKEIQIYVPRYETTFVQELENDSGTSLVPSRDSLEALREDYGVSYRRNPEWQRVEGISVPVRELRFSRRSNVAGFKQMIYTIGGDLLIYRIEAISIYGQTFTLTFQNINTSDSVNGRSISEYKVPSSSNSMKGFFYQDE